MSIGGTFSVERDGLVYCIEFASAATLYKVEAMLKNEQGQWVLTDCTPGHDDKTGFSQRIGRRARWQDALAAALVIVEAESKARSASKGGGKTCE